MKAIEVKKGIYWVGAKDWNVRDFHGYKTHRGSTYNAYLIVDEKVVLVDTVKREFYDEMLARIKSVIDPRKIDMVISNHVEMDHSGGLAHLMEEIPNAEIITSPTGETGLKKHFGPNQWKYKIVKTGSSVSIGNRTLQFVQVPFVHWPDSMVTYCPEDKILFSNDAFGQHIVPNGIFDDENSLETVMEEATKYYANIVSPFAGQVEKAMDAVGGLDVTTIATSHGVVWRKHVSTIIQAYVGWHSQKNNGSAVIVYDSMWHSTETMAKQIQSFFEERQIPVKMHSLKHNHISDIMTDVLQAKYVAIGTPVLNMGMMPTVAGFLAYLKGLKPKNKVGFVFGSYGWDNKVYKEIEETLKQMEWNIPVATQAVKWVPSEQELATLEQALPPLLS